MSLFTDPAAGRRAHGVLALARLVVLPVLGLLVGLLAAVLITTTLPRSYRSTSSVVLVPRQARSSQAGPNGVELALSLTASVAQLAESRAVSDAARRTAGIGATDPGGGWPLGLGPAATPGIQSSAEAGNQIVTITATAGTAGQAAALADAAAVQTTVLYTRLRLGGSSDVLLRQLDRADLPLRPNQPQPLLDASLGALAGLLIGIGALALARRSDRRFRGVAEIESALRLPTVGQFRRPGRPRPADRAALAATLTLLAGDRPLRRVVVTGVGRRHATGQVADQVAAALRSTGSDWRTERFDVSTPFGHPDADIGPVVLVAPQLLDDEHGATAIAGADAVLLVIDSDRAQPAEATRAGRLLGRTAVPVVGTVVVGQAVEIDGWRVAAWSDRLTAALPHEPPIGEATPGAGTTPADRGDPVSGQAHTNGQAHGNEAVHADGAAHTDGKVPTPRKAPATRRATTATRPKSTATQQSVTPKTTATPKAPATRGSTSTPKATATSRTTTTPRSTATPRASTRPVDSDAAE